MPHHGPIPIPNTANKQRTWHSSPWTKILINHLRKEKKKHTTKKVHTDTHKQTHAYKQMKKQKQVLVEIKHANRRTENAKKRQ